MKTMKLTVFLFTIIGILIGCTSKYNGIKVSPSDSTENIVSKPKSPETFPLENCHCKEYPELNNIISCEETVFSNGAKIYRRFSCDSSWLVFENKNIKKSIFSLDKDLIELTDKLGFVEWDEYKESILIANRMRSGSSAPYEYYLYDIETGKEIINLGQEIYLSKDHSDPYFISLDEDNSAIIISNLDTRKSAFFPFDMSKIDAAFKNGGFVLYPEELFGPGEIKNNIFKIEYSYRVKGKDDELSEEVVIDLNKLDFK